MTALNEEQINAFKAQLIKRNNELREEIRQELIKSDNEQYHDLAGEVHDLGDESVADLLADRNIMIIDQHINEVRDIEAALLRISMGTYGICSDCDAEINVARLEVQPSAALCIDCQQQRESQDIQNRPSL